MVAGVAGNLGGQSMVVWLGLIAALTIPPAIIWIGRLTYHEAPKLTMLALAVSGEPAAQDRCRLEELSPGIPQGSRLDIPRHRR